MAPSPKQVLYHPSDNIRELASCRFTPCTGVSSVCPLRKALPTACFAFTREGRSATARPSATRARRRAVRERADACGGLRGADLDMIGSSCISCTGMGVSVLCVSSPLCASLCTDCRPVSQAQAAVQSRQRGSAEGSKRSDVHSAPSHTQQGSPSLVVTGSSTALSRRPSKSPAPRESAVHCTPFPSRSGSGKHSGHRQSVRTGVGILDWR